MVCAVSVYDLVFVWELWWYARFQCVIGVRLGGRSGDQGSSGLTLVIGSGSADSWV